MFDNLAYLEEYLQEKLMNLEKENPNEVGIVKINLGELFSKTQGLIQTFLSNKALFIEKLREKCEEILLEEIEVFILFENLPPLELLKMPLRGSTPSKFVRVEGIVEEIAEERTHPLFFHAKDNQGKTHRVSNFNFLKNKFSGKVKSRDLPIDFNPEEIFNVKVIKVQEILLKCPLVDFFYHRVFLVGKEVGKLEKGMRISLSGEYKFSEIKYGLRRKYGCYLLPHEVKTIQETSGVSTSLEEIVEKSFPQFKMSKWERITFLSSFLDFKENNLNLRSKQHILVCGGKNSGKTVLLEEISRISDAIFVDGLLTTSAGLTYSFVKDPEGTSFFQRGALPRADGGVLLIDDLDQMAPEVLRSLYTPLESGEIFLSKAGLKERIKAEASLIATVSQEPSKALKILPAPLLSRFDHILECPPLKQNWQEIQKTLEKENFGIQIKKTKVQGEIDPQSKLEAYNFITQSLGFYGLIKKNFTMGFRILGNLMRSALAWKHFNPEVENSFIEGIKKYLHYQNFDEKEDFEKEEEFSKETISLLLLKILKQKYSSTKSITLDEILIELPTFNLISLLNSLNDFEEKGLIYKEKSKGWMIKFDPAKFIDKLGK